MGIYVEVIKSDNDEDFVYYTYQFFAAGLEYKSASGKKRYKQEMVSGKLKIDKKTGDVHIVDLAKNDSGAYAKYAASGLIKCWVNGDFPDKASWAS